MKRRRRVRDHVLVLGVFGLLGSTLIAAAPAFSLARWVDSASSTGSAAADTLAPPTGLAAAGPTIATLTWTPTVDGYATGYRIERGSVTGGPYTTIGSVTPGSASTTTDSPGSGTWFYVLRSTFHAWSSADSDEASVVIGSTTTTAVTSCTDQAADTSGAGDDNGYESSPARVCADDGQVAVDSKSGTSFSDASCGTGATPAAGKDRHRFWGYAFGLPATISSIAGITVRADLSVSNNGGTTNLCVQLSGDGGATWTTIKSLPVAGTSQNAYTFGSATDTWGRAWAVGDFSPTNFRARVIDATTMSNKDFELDYLGISVAYVP